LRDTDFLEALFSKYSFDGVLHFAWLKAVWESTQKPLEYFDNNIVGSLRLFEVMEKYNVKNIIFSSSATVYDLNQPIPSPSLKPNGRGLSETWISEDSLVWNCTNPYGTTKFLLENILRDLSKFAWFQVVNLRYFNPIGAHESWCLWEDPSGIPNNLLPYVMRVVTGEYECVRVFGNDYDTKDGTWVRDYIDVCDLVDGHLKAYEYLENPTDLPWSLMEGTNCVFETFNLWTGKWVSVLEMIQAAQKVTGIDVPYQIFSRREWDVAEVFCNPEKAEKILWWSAKVSLEESLEKSFRFVNMKNA
jgi:UDP-glucose 4-epimerase